MSSKFAAVVVCSAFGLAACASMSGAPATAVAEIKPTQGNAVTGTARFVQQGDRTLVQVRVAGLTPNSVHGFHVHEKGDCSAPDGTSAGGHFNPGGKAHGSADKPEHHAGDLPNLRADAAGTANYEWQTDALTVGTGSNGVIGRSVVVHRDPDDYTSQPAGNSGARVACGVIAAVK
jgi:Cu-Zn family superoxide dismutase